MVNGRGFHSDRVQHTQCMHAVSLSSIHPSILLVCVSVRRLFSSSFFLIFVVWSFAICAEPEHTRTTPSSGTVTGHMAAFKSRASVR